MPHHARQVDIGAAKALWGTHCRASSAIQCMPVAEQCSLLANGFNRLWARALRHREELGVTHFAMIHSDIDPEMWFLEKLHAILVESEADVVSVVAPLKSEHGLTSTGAIDLDDPERQIRRLSLREVHGLPETFSADDLPWPNHMLAVNTGLWICDLRKPWCEDVCFTVTDKMVKGQLPGDKFPYWFANALPEDWGFSQDLHRWGCKVMATRAVKLQHHGDVGYTNEPWGTWNTDKGFESIRKQGFADHDAIDREIEASLVNA
jgi:hypothetical protein